MKPGLRTYLFAVIISSMGIHVFASNTYDTENHVLDAGAFYNYNSISANVTDMFRYGEFHTSLFTGRLQVSVPIYKVDDPDFNMDIALHYNAEGFKPRKHSGYVGYNWHLEAGGCITREVQGLPDEIYGIEAVNSGAHYSGGVEGMYHFITQNPDAENMNKNDIFALPLAPDSQACLTGNNLWINVGNGCTYKVDYMPDIFHFNFLGRKGSFMINNTGEVQIISGDFVDVDLSGILADWDKRHPDKTPYYAFPMYPEKNSSITIRTTDGYTYIFGGDISKLEYTVNACDRSHFLPLVLNDYTGIELNPATVSSWHLSKIIAPNQRVVTFYYKPAGEDEWANILDDYPVSVPKEDDPLWEFNEYFDRFGRYYQVQATLHDNIMKNNVLYGQFTDEEYQCLLNFYNPPYIHVGDLFYMYSATKTCVLDSILISGDQPLKIIFNNSQESKAMYDSSAYAINSKRQYQLDSIRILASGRNIKTANLSYNYKSSGGQHPSNWRFLSSAHVSGVGTYQMTYNNGSYPDLYNLGLTHAGIYHVESGTSDESDDYGYYVNNSTIALLEKLIYPTGGYQTYSYEPYHFNKKRKYSVLTDSSVEMNTTNESGTKKGARIREVKTFDKINHQIERKLYTYADGVFYDNLRVYNLANDLYPQYGWPIRYTANYGLLETHIGYGKVTEEVTNAQGDTYTTIYQFDTGDNSYTTQNDANMNERYYCDNRKFGIMEGQLLYGSKLKKWGKLLYVKNYESNNTLQRLIHYDYNNTQLCNDTVVIFNCGYGYALAKKLYINPDVITAQVTTNYSNGDSLVNSKFYAYDSKLRVKTDIIEDSRDIQHFTKYFYPDDIPGVTNMGSSPPPLCLMILGHRVGTPVETISGYISGQTEYITGGTIDIYKNIIFPENNISSRLYKTLSLSLSEPTTTYQPMSVSNGEISYDARYKLDCEYEFDIMYRPTSIKPFGRTPTTLTWDGIYKTSQTTGNQTWTYTYIPHVGVSSITDPRGITTYYTYDSAGRLVEEYQLVNENKQILNVYQYHIKTE